MEIYDNENEQVDAIKRFFAENGKALAVGVVLGIGALLGWRYWNSHQSESARTTSLVYDKAISAISAEKPATLEAVDKFVDENQNNYGALAALNLARQYVDTQALDKAAATLQKGVTATKDSQLQALLNLRLARVLVQQKQADAALKTLETIKGEGWTAMVADMRGEALLSKGDKQGAREAWSQGVNSGASPALREMMQMKINNLSS
ncbi:YfgM family protein [Erwinia sp. HR93]|uniref:YfgM family protein n=1 Tax=Erwinia sp. HR93 TaxID=3094840 RepID=UPI002ADEF436|nr:YfgM family protein [Erwinia sp. HR93]MEA1064345.1 YfgM family protein [Erwinia sp. HR93]